MRQNSPEKIINVLSFLFFISGVAALIYQIAWQRLLFANLGSDIDSVTIIVSVFMLGLGVGALLGGRAVDMFPERAILLFVLVEVGIGIFGLGSSAIILYVGTLVHDSNLLLTAVISFLILLFPTTLMGSTLPVLITFVAKRWGNIGAATGHMYSINTLGAALGAFVTGYWLFGFLPLSGVIYLAATMNFLVAIVAVSFLRNCHD